MNRDNKEFSEGTISHIYNRGNGKDKIFLDEQDYKAFLFRLAIAIGFDPKQINSVDLFNLPHSRIRIEQSKKDSFKIYAFCLMPNHFHLMIEQCSDESISKLISKVSASYSKYFNNKYNRVGHVFQDCFKAVNAKTNSQIMWVSAYIHMNPVKDNIVKKPEQYKWSSYLDYTSDRKILIINTEFLKEVFGSNEKFKKETDRLYDDEYAKETL